MQVTHLKTSLQDFNPKSGSIKLELHNDTDLINELFQSQKWFD